jgi:hypothetical protein
MLENTDLKTLLSGNGSVSAHGEDGKPACRCPSCKMMTAMHDLHCLAVVNKIAFQGDPSTEGDMVTNLASIISTATDNALTAIGELIKQKIDPTSTTPPDTVATAKLYLLPDPKDQDKYAWIVVSGGVAYHSSLTSFRTDNIYDYTKEEAMVDGQMFAERLLAAKTATLAESMAIVNGHDYNSYTVGITKRS